VGSTFALSKAGTVEVPCVRGLHAIGRQVEAILGCATKKAVGQLGPGRYQGLEVPVKGKVRHIKIVLHKPRIG
jgi:hypothetical protein